LEHWPPLRLAQVARVGSVLIATEFLWSVLDEGLIRLHAHYFGPYLGIFATAVSILLRVAPIVIGAVIVALALWRLSDGLTRIRWNEPEIEAARHWAESHDLSRTAKWLLWSFVFVDFVASWKIAHYRTTLFLDSLPLICIPSLVVSAIVDRLRQEAYTPPTPPSDGIKRRHPGFHSEQWGNRDTPNHPENPKSES